MALAAFAGNEWGYMRAKGFWYDAINFLSAVGLFAYAYTQGVVPFMITNSVWVRRGWVPSQGRRRWLARRVRGEYVEPRKTLRGFLERTREEKILKVY